MKSKKAVSILALVTGLVLGASAASAWQREAALGADGALYMVAQGRYGDLFPGGQETAPDHSVLALDVLRPGADRERHLVPGTDDDAVERSPTVVFEDSSNAVFLVWETAINYHPILKLSSFGHLGWEPEIEIRGSLFGYKSSPQFAITRDSYTSEGHAISRTILHLIWEQQDGDDYRTFYAPVIIEDGKYIGQTPLIPLNDLDQNPPADLAFDLATELLLSPSIQPGRDGQTVNVAFADAASKRLVTLQIGVLPRQLNRLADRARAVIIDMGARLTYPRNLHTLSDRLHDAILSDGGAFQPEVVQAIAGRAADEILHAGGRNLQTLAGDARAVIIDMGARLTGPGLRNSASSSSVAPKIVEVEKSELALAAAAAENASATTHLLQFRVASSRPAPRVPDGDLTLFPSRAGEDVLLAAVQSDRVLYRDTTDGGWSDTRELGLSDSLDLGRALDILNERIRDR